jgi:capsular exopolysaccharide synthesis family protein
MNKQINSSAAQILANPENSAFALQYLDRNELRETARKLWRRQRLIFGTSIFLTLLAMIVIFTLTPRYTATVLIMLDPRESKFASVDTALGGPSKDTEAVYSEAAVLTSQQLIRKLVEKYDLVHDAEFNESLKPKTLWSKINPLAFIPIDWNSHISDMTESEKVDAEKTKVVNFVLNRLSVTPSPRTRVLVLSIQSESPRKAVELANGLADLYVVDQLDAKFEATQRVSNWLNERLADLRTKVDEADRAVETYRTRSGLLESFRAGGGVMGGKGVTLAQQQMADLTTQMTIARTERSAAEAKLRQVKDILGRAGSEEAVSEVLESSLIQQLREAESGVERSIAELSTTYGEKHPKLIAARAQLSDVRSKIKIEVGKIVQALENSAAVARAREAAVTSQIDDIKRQVASSNESEVKLHALEMDAQTNRALMENFMSRFKETSAQESQGIQTPDSRIISRAELPQSASFPKKGPFSAIAFVISLMIGVIVAFIAEYLDRGFRSGVQFEHETGTPVLAMIPQVDESKGRAADHLVEKPMSSYAEAIRSVYTSLLLTQSSDPIKTIVVSSCQPSEGKSTLSVSLTRMIALSGHKVILIEADLRRPSIHNQLGIDRGVGLAEVLVGTCSFEDAIYSDPRTNADILLAGKETLNPSKLLASHQMEELIRELRTLYDAIIIDTAPVLAVSDGLLLANKADGTIYSCRWATTSRETAALGLKELREANARVIGAVISMVDIKKTRAYGYADTSYYYSSTYKKYYSD